MSLNPCNACGGEVRLGGERFTFNRRHGVSHYIAHMVGSRCKNTDGYTCAMMKPYPEKNEDKAWFQMVQAWNRDNPIAQKQKTAGDAK